MLVFTGTASARAPYHRGTCRRRSRRAFRGPDMPGGLSSKALLPSALSLDDSKLRLRAATLMSTPRRRRRLLLWRGTSMRRFGKTKSRLPVFRSSYSRLVISATVLRWKIKSSLRTGRKRSAQKGSPYSQVSKEFEAWIVGDASVVMAGSAKEGVLIA